MRLFNEESDQRDGTGPIDVSCLAEELLGLLRQFEDSPDLAGLMGLCETLYAASLLKEEGRAVRARVVVAPPEAFTLRDGPPDAPHVIRFSSPHPFTANEVKRLSPAASFFHSAIAVWPGADGEFRIWGILNTGPRWMNLVAGGRKPAASQLSHPHIQVRDPGWVVFYRGYELIAEWRGREFHGPRLDVFEADFLKSRFLGIRESLVRELGPDGLPPTLSGETYAELVHLVAMQFVRRVINLVRTSGHGGSLILVPPGEEGEEVASRWIESKYGAEPGEAGMRLRLLIMEILFRVGELSEPGASLEEAWHTFRHVNDLELDRLEEGFYELARFFSDLMQVDGALVLDQRLRLIGFGAEIRVDSNVLSVGQATDLEGSVFRRWPVRNDGTRHRSVYRLCSVAPEVVGFVISQDSTVRLIANVREDVVFWSHSAV